MAHLLPHRLNDLLLPALGVAAGIMPPGSGAAAGPSPAVVVNGQPLGDDLRQALQQRFGAVAPGRYWYDAVTGAWGSERGPTAGWLPPGLPLPQPLRPDASGGGDGRLSGVFINGRELHPLDVQALRRLLGGPVWPGQWWVDSAGSFGLLIHGQRGPQLGNLWLLARRQGRAEPWGLASPDGRQFLGHDGVGHFATGSRGESWFGS